MKLNKLTPEEEAVILKKGTEKPFSGRFHKHNEKGTYTCRQCGVSLYRSSDKFDSHCGWPSFDDAIPGNVTRVPDSDGRRTEIICSHCGAHLGHVFQDEGFTQKNTRYCVNSISMDFVADPQGHTDTAYLASGCFWGTQYWLQKAKGVISSRVGFMGGTPELPTYEQVCSGTTGHAETVEVIFDTTLTTYEDILKIFFETHDQSQVDRQGPDVGTQYRSEIFFRGERQCTTANELVQNLKDKGYTVATRVEPASIFWPAEPYHQDYYTKKHGRPYCHVYTRKF